MSRQLKNKFLIIFSILIILIISLSTYSVQATSNSVNDDAINSSSEEYYNDDDSNNNVIKENSSDSSLQSLSPSSVTSVTSKENYASANLSLNNILCVILIAIGVLLILFAIAILIRINR